MKHMKHIPLILFLMATPVHARSNNWVTECEKNSQSCYDFVQGIIETARTMAMKAKLDVCLPAELNANHVVEYIMAHVKTRTGSALQYEPLSDVVIGALEANYPCKGS